MKYIEFYAKLKKKSHFSKWNVKNWDLLEFMGCYSEYFDEIVNLDETVEGH